MSYRRTVEFRGDPTAVMETARVVLIGDGFAVSEPRAGHLVARAPLMFNSRQSPLRGLSALEIEVTGTTLSVVAERRNVLFMIGFMVVFPPGLILALNLARGTMERFPRELLPWLVIWPLLVLWIWYRTNSALGRFVDNLARVGARSR